MVLTWIVFFVETINFWSVTQVNDYKTILTDYHYTVRIGYSAVNQSKEEKKKRGESLKD